MENTMSNASFGQAVHLLAFVGQKDPKLEQLQKLYTSGLLSDLFDGNIDQVDRDKFRKALGLCPLDTFIHIDRSIRPVYPDWVKMGMRPELELTGPVEYDLGTINTWLHDGQKNGRYMEGYKLYEYLKEKKMLESCLSLRDGEEIQKKGIAVFRKFFQGKAVFLWKSVVQDRNGYLNVPYLYEDGDEVAVYWYWLDSIWDDHYPALRFAS